ncbi:hypothetical protein [Nostoc sp.]|uniref:hypothetical protein n=1 Tax=Nostoc sp. TaxID=1180 RepID=UPI002FF6740D
MAQIKVLNLDDSCSLSELSYEDAKTINGGILGASGAGVISWWYGRRGFDQLADMGAGAALGGLIGPAGASLSTPE